jgi:glycosyl transferase family 25
MIRDHFDRIFVINMARSILRRGFFLSQAQIFGLTNAEIIKAVDGRTLDLDKIRSQGILQWDVHLKRDLTAGEVGCYMSHMNIWKSVLERKLKTALICEDDVVWRIDANAIVDRFMSEVPGDWDILHFHNNVRIGSGRYNDSGRRKISEYVWQGFNEGRGAACYAITARGASFLLSIAYPICSTVDGRTNWLTGWWKECKGYKGYICWPFPCEAGMKSEIDMITQRPEETNLP